ncbi:hypothetical protein QQZ08_000907 [Neonectria magnoliae]|uniref:beta-glucosidase n=1 Tax=Neonectria magnoliae TaxID=2732573 RepID=A0ABR1IFC4_9HYPO
MGGVRRLLTLGPVVDEANFESRYKYQHGNIASQYAGINHLFNDQLRPYIRALEANPVAIMVSYAIVDLVPMPMNEYMIQDILRGKLGFNGVVMSDAGSIANMYTQSKVATSYEDAALQAL